VSSLSTGTVRRTTSTGRTWSLTVLAGHDGTAPGNRCPLPTTYLCRSLRVCLSVCLSHAYVMLQRPVITWQVVRYGIFSLTTTATTLFVFYFWLSSFACSGTERRSWDKWKRIFVPAVSSVKRQKLRTLTPNGQTLLTGVIQQRLFVCLSVCFSTRYLKI